jgi:hypothetical protein
MVVEAVTRLAWEALACPTPTVRVVIQVSLSLSLSLSLSPLSPPFSVTLSLHPFPALSSSFNLLLFLHCPAAFFLDSPSLLSFLGLFAEQWAQEGFGVYSLRSRVEA